MDIEPSGSISSPSRYHDETTWPSSGRPSFDTSSVDTIVTRQEAMPSAAVRDP